MCAVVCEWSVWYVCGVWCVLMVCKCVVCVICAFCLCDEGGGCMCVFLFVKQGPRA